MLGNVDYRCYYIRITNITKMGKDLQRMIVRQWVVQLRCCCGLANLKYLI